MAHALSPISMQSFFDNNGQLIRPSRLYFYKPNTLDPVTVYQDQELSVPHPQPVVSGGSGRVPPIYVGEDDYRIRVFDTYGQLVEDVPWLPGAQEHDGGGGGGPAPDTAIVTGDVIWNFSNGGVRTGWVRLNGGSIGSASSGATERANADTENLFKYLWGQDAGPNLLVIEPSRGASAASDWLANKRLVLPDGANSVLAGIATMGLPQGSRAKFIAGTFVKGTVAQVGSVGGVGKINLTIGQLPTHNHAVTDPGHAHSASQSAHNHTLHDPSHTHGASQPAHNHSAYDGGHVHALSDPGHAHFYDRFTASGPQWIQGGPSSARENAVNATQVAYTGVSCLTGYAQVVVNAAQPGVTVSAALTGIWLDAAQPNVGVSPATTGIATQNVGSGTDIDNAMPFILGTFFMKL